VPNNLHGALGMSASVSADELLARAGRLSSDLSGIIKRHPVDLAALLRTTEGLTADDVARLTREAQKAKGSDGLASAICKCK
jgi:hypothetical protein